MVVAAPGDSQHVARNAWQPNRRQLVEIAHEHHGDATKWLILPLSQHSQYLVHATDLRGADHGDFIDN
jgi:hypothetical protein